MQTRWFYYLCHRCGYHSAFYELRTRCPICGSGKKAFELIGTSEDSDIREKIQKLSPPPEEAESDEGSAG